MSALQIFKFNEADIRIITDEQNNPWWVAKDVAEVLSYSDTQTMTRRLDDDEKGMQKLHTLGGMQELSVINESGLYSSILGSSKPESKAFKKWVTSEVLPTIRKTGSYQEPMSETELMAKALKVAQKTLNELEAANSALTVRTEIYRPKAEYFDALVDRNLLTNFRDTAKQLGIKEREFIDKLVKHKYVYRNNGKLMPYAEKNNGLFEVKECMNDKTTWAGVQTLITPKGRETFRLLSL